MEHKSQEGYKSQDFPDYMCKNPLILACHNNDYPAIELLMSQDTDNRASQSNASSRPRDANRKEGDGNQKGGGTNFYLVQFSPKTTT